MGWRWSERVCVCVVGSGTNSELQEFNEETAPHTGLLPCGLSEKLNVITQRTFNSRVCTGFIIKADK